MSMTPDREIRSAVLARIRDVRPSSGHPPIVRDYRTGLPPHLDAVRLFIERVSDYRATVQRPTSRHIPSTLREVLSRHDVKRILIPSGIEPKWTADLSAFELVGDEPPLSHRQLDRIDGVISTCAIAIAETGTIVLDGGPGQGRRAVSLLPDLLVCVVRTTQIVGDVSEALARLDPRRPMTWISGPSATSDIELNRVEGVHGPRRLEVVVIP